MGIWKYVWSTLFAWALLTWCWWKGEKIDENVTTPNIDNATQVVAKQVWVITDNNLTINIRGEDKDWFKFWNIVIDWQTIELKIPQWATQFDINKTISNLPEDSNLTAKVEITWVDGVDWEAAEPVEVITPVKTNKIPEEENDVPEANNDSAEVTEWESVIIDVLSNDSDLNWDTLTIQSVWTPEYWIAEIQDWKIKYTAENGYTWTVNFEYIITDWIDTATATVSINVIEAKEMSFSWPENWDDWSDYEINLDLEWYDINDLTFKVRWSYNENWDWQDYEEDIVLWWEVIGWNVALDNNWTFTIKTTNKWYWDNSSMWSLDWVEIEAEAPDWKTITHKFTVN